LLGAVAIATALAFGLGGRNVAGDLLERWRNQIRTEASRQTNQRPIPTTGGEIRSPLPGSDMPHTSDTTTRSTEEPEI
jgi:hypothetical protein